MIYSDSPSPFSSTNSHLSPRAIVLEVTEVCVCVNVCTSMHICNLEGIRTLTLLWFSELVSIMETSSHRASLPSPPAKLLFCTSVATGSCFWLYQEETRGLQWESKRFPVLTKYRCSGNGGLVRLTYRELLSSNTVSCGRPVHSSLSPSLPDSKCPLE